MPDHSHLDSLYFIDESVYNCPFCNRRHVSYQISGYAKFDWSDKKPCICVFVLCESCGNKSMHLTFQNLQIISRTYQSKVCYDFRIPENTDPGNFLNQVFFYSVPTSFFVLDERIPRILRELLTEAEGCLKSNYLTGASACARKIVYELAVLSKTVEENYDDRIKSLKALHPEVDPIFFDTLLTIQQVTSTKVHEQSYDGWEAKHLRIILAALSDVLHEVYVVPALRSDRRKAILNLKDELVPLSENGEPGTV